MSQLECYQKKVKKSSAEDSDPDASHESDSSDSYDITSINGVPVVSLEQDRINFVKALPYCLFFDGAFRLGVTPKQHFSYCPCGRYMAPWRKTFGLKDNSICPAKTDKRKVRQGLQDHLRVKGERGGDWKHHATLVYLTELYGGAYKEH